MSEYPEAYLEHRPHLTLLDKASNWCAWAVSIALFWHLGWLAMSPMDPLGAVSLTSRPRALAMWLQAAGLAMVAAAAGSLLAGRRVPAAGAFAAGIGLAAVSLRGGTMESLFIGAERNQVDLRMFSWMMSAETAQWAAVMLLSFLVSSFVTRWCYGIDYPRDRPADAFKHVGAAALGTFIGVYFFSTGLNHRAMTHGQSCFVAAAAAALGSYVAHAFVPVRRYSWSVLGVALAGVAGYAWASFKPTAPGLPPGIPANPFLRILPIQMASVSMASAVAMYWYLTHARLHEREIHEGGGSG